MSAFLWPCTFHHARNSSPIGRAICRRQTATRLSASLGTFDPSDFELRRPVGKLGYDTLVDWEYYGDENALKEAKLTQPKTTVERSEPAVRLYEGVIAVGPLMNSRVLLKEFLPAGEDVGRNEAERYVQLVGGTADEVSPDELPVAVLLGGFTGGQIFQSLGFQQRWKASFPTFGEPPRAGTPWLVFRWEGLLTADDYPNHPQQGEFMDRFQTRNPYRRRRGYLRVLIRKAFESLDFVHQRGIVHKALGPSSLLVNTLEERFQGSLEVKLQDFGFSKALSGLDEVELRRARENGATTPFDISKFAQAEDIYAMGYVVLELVFSSFSTDGPGPRTTQMAFKRILEEVFEMKMDSFREYCVEEDAWSLAVEFLDERDGAGWDLIETLVSTGDDGKRLASLGAHKIAQHSSL